MSVEAWLKIKHKSSMKKCIPRPNSNSNYISHIFYSMLTRERIFSFKFGFQNLGVGDHEHCGMISLIMPAVTVREVCHG